MIRAEKRKKCPENSSILGEIKYFKRNIPKAMYQKQYTRSNIPSGKSFVWLAVTEQKPTAIMSDEKSPTRISRYLFSTSCSEMELKNGK